MPAPARETPRGVAREGTCEPALRMRRPCPNGVLVPAFVVPRPIIFINRDNSCLFRGLVRNRYRRAVLQGVVGSCWTNTLELVRRVPCKPANGRPQGKSREESRALPGAVNTGDARSGLGRILLEPELRRWPDAGKQPPGP